MILKLVAVLEFLLESMRSSRSLLLKGIMSGILRLRHGMLNLKNYQLMNDISTNSPSSL